MFNYLCRYYYTSHAFIAKIKKIVSVRIQSLLAEKAGDSPNRGNVAKRQKGCRPRRGIEPLGENHGFEHKKVGRDLALCEAAPVNSPLDCLVCQLSFCVYCVLLGKPFCKPQNASPFKSHLEERYSNKNPRVKTRGFAFWG